MIMQDATNGNFGVGICPLPTAMLGLLAHIPLLVSRQVKADVASGITGYAMGTILG
jgi:hypothetical protein